MRLNDTIILANKLMQRYGLIDKAWYFEFDNAIRRFGCTHYNTKRITISKHLALLNNEQQVTNTILHEIAHAIAGASCDHNALWRDVAVSIGCDGNRCYDSGVVKQPHARYTAICPKCHKHVQKARKCGDLACGRCCKRYNNDQYSRDYLLTWRINKC